MKSKRGFARRAYLDLQDQVREALRREDFDGAIELLIAAAEQTQLSVGELVTLGRIMQLGSGHGRALDTARRAFDTAIQLDPESPGAWLEKGWLLYSVMDDAREALVAFNRASELARALAEEATKGARECLEELGDEGEVGLAPGDSQ